MSVGGFGADVRMIFQEATATLFDSTCSVSRLGLPQHVGSFNYTQTPTVVYQNVPCSIQHGAFMRTVLERYADRIVGRSLAQLFVPPSIILKDRDIVLVAGGDTYEVIGDPHLDGPDDPCLTASLATNPPVVVNP